MANLYNLETMVGRVLQNRRGCPFEVARSFINERIRMVMDWRNWCDTIKKGVISCPAAYSTGTPIVMTRGSAVVTGTGTGWPVSDVASTTILDSITPGVQEVAPASMAGITPDSALLVEAGALTQEIVSVVKTSAFTFTAEFAQAHNSGVSATQSSLAGLQFKAGGGYPVFTVMGVRDASTLYLDTPWGGPSISLPSYQILKMYCTLSYRLKDILWALDEQQGIPLKWHIPVTAINIRDPQRTEVGDPLYLVDLGPNANRNMQHEIWPAPTSARQLSYAVYEQWPEMVELNDLAPSFIDPTLFIEGATASAKRTRFARDDPFYDPKTADTHEALAKALLVNAANADDSKWLKSYSAEYERILGVGGANWQMSHDSDLFYASF